MTTPIENQAATIADPIAELIAIVEEDVGSTDPDFTDDESVGWTDGKPLPMTFGHVRRARAALATIAELRERLREAEADQLCPIGMDSNPEYCSAASCRFCRAKRLKAAEARATAAERALSDLHRQIDEACAVTECCSTLQEMSALVIEGAQTKADLSERDAELNALAILMAELQDGVTLKGRALAAADVLMAAEKSTECVVALGLIDVILRFKTSKEAYDFQKAVAKYREGK